MKKIHFHHTDLMLLCMCTCLRRDFICSQLDMQTRWAAGPGFQNYVSMVMKQGCSSVLRLIFLQKSPVPKLFKYIYISYTSRNYVVVFLSKVSLSLNLYCCLSQRIFGHFGVIEKLLRQWLEFHLQMQLYTGIYKHVNSQYCFTMTWELAVLVASTQHGICWRKQG